MLRSLQFYWLQLVDWPMRLQFFISVWLLCCPQSGSLITQWFWAGLDVAYAILGFIQHIQFIHGAHSSRGSSIGVFSWTPPPVDLASCSGVPHVSLN